jgi:hypothetical protein
MEARRTEIIALTDKVCDEQLDGEYRNLARMMVDMLLKENPVVLVHNPGEKSHRSDLKKPAFRK